MPAEGVKKSINIIVKKKESLLTVLVIIYYHSVTVGESADVNRVNRCVADGGPNRTELHSNAALIHCHSLVDGVCASVFLARLLVNSSPM